MRLHKRYMPLIGSKDQKHQNIVSICSKMFKVSKMANLGGFINLETSQIQTLGEPWAIWESRGTNGSRPGGNKRSGSHGAALEKMSKKPLKLRLVREKRKLTSICPKHVFLLFPDHIRGRYIVFE